MLATCGDDLKKIRDRALLGFGFAVGSRPLSEGHGADVRDRVGSVCRVSITGWTIASTKAGVTASPTRTSPSAIGQHRTQLVFL